MRGLRAAALGVGLGLVLLFVATAIGQRLGVVAVPWERPEGPTFWNLARVSGVTAYVALTAVVLLGLLVSTGSLDRWIARARSLELHRWLSAVMLALMALHGLSFLGDRQAGFDLLDVLVPFIAPYRPAAVGLGVLALHLAIVVIASGPLRARLGPRLWRALHLLSFPSFFLVSAHGLLAGSDAHRLGLRALFLTCVGLVLALTLHRLATLLRPHAPQPEGAIEHV